MISPTHTLIRWQTKYSWIIGGILFVGLFALIGIALFRTETAPEALPQRYYNPEYQFSFGLPANYVAQAFAEGEGQTILVRDTSGTAVAQVHVSEMEGVAPLNQEILRRDFEGTPLFDIESFSLASQSSASGVTFSFEDAESRTVSEVWFVYNQVMYQWTIAVGQEAVVRGIIESLVWQ